MKCEKCGEYVDWDNPAIHYGGHKCSDKKKDFTHLNSNSYEISLKISKEEIQPMQIYPSKTLHAAFKAKCATEKGNPPMNRKILELMEKWTKEK